MSRHDLAHQAGVPFQEVLAEPGDILYFPDHCWHEVHNLEEGPGLMCGLRFHYSNRALAREVLLREHISPSLAWHKLSSVMALKFHAREKSRPEFNTER